MDEQDLLDAATEGDIDAVKQALRDLNDDAVNKSVDEDGFTPLLLAASFGHVGVASYLVAAKANTLHRASDGSDALLCAVQGGSCEMVQFLVDHAGLAVSGPASTDLDGGATPHMPPLHAALREGQLDVVLQLVHLKASADETFDGMTALQLAQLQSDDRPELLEGLLAESSRSKTGLVGVGNGVGADAGVDDRAASMHVANDGEEDDGGDCGSDDDRCGDDDAGSDHDDDVLDIASVSVERAGDERAECIADAAADGHCAMPASVALALLLGPEGSTHEVSVFSSDAESAADTGTSSPAQQSNTDTASDSDSSSRSSAHAILDDGGAGEAGKSRSTALVGRVLNGGPQAVRELIERITVRAFGPEQASGVGGTEPQPPQHALDNRPKAENSKSTAQADDDSTELPATFDDALVDVVAVSYTHLTLPTIYSV